MLPPLDFPGPTAYLRGGRGRGSCHKPLKTRHLGPKTLTWTSPQTHRVLTRTSPLSHRGKRGHADRHRRHNPLQVHLFSWFHPRSPCSRTGDMRQVPPWRQLAVCPGQARKAQERSLNAEDQVHLVKSAPGTSSTYKPAHAVGACRLVGVWGSRRDPHTPPLISE